MFSFSFAENELIVHIHTFFRSKLKVEESDVLYCTKPPCRDCQNLLKDVKIKTIHCVQESSKQIGVCLCNIIYLLS